MRCIGLNKNFRRCKNHTPFLLCQIHNKQWVYFILITIPTILVLYVSFFRDLIKPVFQKQDTAISKEIENQQSKIVLEMVSYLSKAQYSLSILFDDIYAKKCKDTKNLTKGGGDFFISKTYGTLLDFRKQFDTGTFEFEPVITQGIVVGNDSLRWHDTVKHMVKVRMLPYECQFNLNDPIFFRSDSVFAFFTQLDEKFEVPILIKEKLDFFNNLNYNLISLSQIARSDHAFFLLGSIPWRASKIKHNDVYVVVSPEKETLYSYKYLDGVYEIKSKGKRITAYELMTKLEEIDDVINDWLKNNDVNF